MEDGKSGTDGPRGDEAVDHPADGAPVPPADPVELGRLLEVDPLRGEYRSAGQQGTEVAQMAVIACAGQHFHRNGIAHSELAGSDGMSYSDTDRTARSSEELDPG